MIRFFSFLFGAAFTCLLAAFLVFKVPLALVATLGVGVACLGWLIAVVVLPWNLYFRARHLLAEMANSERRDIAVDEVARGETREVERRMLRVSLALHLGSALLLALGSWLYAQPLGYAFAGLFLLSTLFRPAVEYYQFLQEKLDDILKNVRYPREDVVKLVSDVNMLVEKSVEQEKRNEQASEVINQLRATMQEGDALNQRKLEAVSRKFEETIDRLTDNQEIISGIKAFLRLVQPARQA
jgi:hypothetical protein